MNWLTKQQKKLQSWLKTKQQTALYPSQPSKRKSGHSPTKSGKDNGTKVNPAEMYTITFQMFQRIVTNPVSANRQRENLSEYEQVIVDFMITCIK